MWHSMFYLPVPVAEKILRAAVIYAFLVIALRVGGKRELAQLSSLDFILLMAVANAVQNGIIGNDNSITGAVIAATTLFAVNELLNRAEYALPWLSTALEGTATYLIENGKPVGKALFRAGISLPELRAIARRQGYQDLSEVHTAILETNGTISMFKKGEPQIYHPAEPGGLRIGKRRRTRP